MSTREYRLSEFNQDQPRIGTPVQILADDHSGTYLLPFKCEWRDEAWYNCNSPKGAKPLEAKVIGWRFWGR
jgi:hypothetical protein